MEKEKNSTDPLDYMPGKVWEALHPLILGGNDTTRDLSKPHLKQIFVKSYPYIIFLYGILICSGFLSNCFVFCYITKKKLYKDETYSFLLNIALSDMVKCVIVLPLSLYVLLIRNWVLGELLCSFLPMIQDIPQHVSTLTIMILVYDRFRYIRKPHRPRVPAFVCSSGTWLTAVCLVLPYPMYIMYIDFGQIYPGLPAVQGAGMCTVNLLDDIKDYTRGIFVITFATPLIIIACLFIQISRELAKQNPAPAIKFEARARDAKTKLETAQTGSAEVQLEHDRSSQYSRGSFREPDGGRTLYEFREPYINVIKERRTLKFLISIFLLYVVCLSPLMVLKVGRMSIEETYENMALMDVVYINFVWIAFLPTCTSPVIFLFWQMSSSSVERIRGYFRLSSRKMGHSNETVTTVTGTPASNQSKRYHRSEETLDSNSCQQDSIST